MNKNKGTKRTQYYREVDFSKRKPCREYNGGYLYKYFCIIHSNGVLYDAEEIYVSEMKEHIKKGRTVDWLEPENEYDPEKYYKRISK